MESYIQILPSHKIDRNKWNACIEQSSNAIIYADYFFLSFQCDQWSGLIIDDYKTIMPLPWRKKWGIRYLYAPAFIQQLGIFGNLSNLPIPQILNRINQFAKYGDIFFNDQNTAILNQIEYFQKTNYTLKLNQSYPQIFASYSQDLIRNLHKSEKRNLTYANDTKIEDAIQLFQSQYKDRFPQYGFKVYQNLTNACLELAKRKQCIIRSVQTESSNEPISIALILKDKKRLYLLLNLTNNIGRAFAANHYLLDQVIQEFCEEDILFDFEGSERKGIKEFYESFHPTLQPYFHYRFNNLPFLINWIRQILNRF
jgi:hypothetical protein